MKHDGATARGTMTDPEFACRVRRCNWTGKNARFLEAARLVLVEGMSAYAAARTMHVHPTTVRRWCAVIAAAQLTPNARPTYYVYWASRRRCLGACRRLSAAHRHMIATSLIRDWLRHPARLGRLLVAMTDDVVLYVAEPGRGFRLVEPS